MARKFKKKWKKRLKKLAKAALIGGALYGGAKLLGRGKGAVSTAGQAIGVDRITPKTDYITKKAAPVVEDVADTTGSYLSRMSGAGDRATQLANQAKRAALSKTVRGVLPPSELASTSRPNRFGTLYKGGGIAKRGTGVALKHGGRTGKQFGGGLNRPVARPIGGVGGVGAPVRPMAYKHGGKVKSMGVAKRGGGVAKR